MHEEKQILVVVHTLIQTAMIHLYRRFAENDPIAYEKCSSAAKAAVEVVKYISDQDYDFLDPIIGVSIVCRRPLVLSYSSLLFSLPGLPLQNGRYVSLSVSSPTGLLAMEQMSVMTLQLSFTL
jgi:hypothetical protein